ncbi:MAG TPA: (3R)-hydroxyacyl-ACP dehydratase subunit HadA [Mycobacterium sp.]|nr:(3R)-hydroxyacyl-ACP dehydratase subunit HadA [Mycobacterium sp.]
MPLSDDLVGTVFRYPDHYEVEREKIREYARAVKAVDPASFNEQAAVDLGHDALVATPTFLSVLVYQATSAFFDHAGISTNDEQIVQVDQKIEFYRPIKEGDRLHCDVSIESIRHAHGTDIIMTKQTVTNEGGEIVQENYTTLAGRSSEDEKGFSDGAA